MDTCQSSGSGIQRVLSGDGGGRVFRKVWQDFYIHTGLTQGLRFVLQCTRRGRVSMAVTRTPS